jgi:hypothetical protein
LTDLQRWLSLPPLSLRACVTLIRVHCSTSFQVTRDSITWVRMLTFTPGVDGSVIPQSSQALLSGTPLTNMNMARLDSSRAVVVCRNPLENNRVRGGGSGSVER